MSRLRLFNDLVNTISTEAEAAKLVKAWLPSQADGIDKGSLGCKPGVKNCSLIAEFVVTYMKTGVVNYAQTMSSNNRVQCDSPFTIPFTSDRRDVISVGGGGHDMAMVREGNTYGFYQAWEDAFHVFPKLNGNISHNVFGDGDDTLRQIVEMIRVTLKEPKSISLYFAS